MLPLMILDRVKLNEEKLNGFTPSQKRHVRQGLSDLRYVRILRTSHEVFIAKTGEFSFVLVHVAVENLESVIIFFYFSKGVNPM